MNVPLPGPPPRPVDPQERVQRALTALDGLDGRPLGRARGRLRRSAHRVERRARRPVRPCVTAVVTRARLDAELVRRGLARSRQQAAELIEQGRVAVRGVPAGKPATVVDRDTPVTVRDTGERDWASRGAHKLIGALDAFGVDVTGARCLDAGASTGGFTDVLLDRGAAHVVAVDVGYGQLVWRLRSDERVQVLDRTNVRALGPDDIGGPVADHRGRPLVHLAAHRAARARRLHQRRTASCCPWSNPSSRWAGSGSVPAAWCATRSCGWPRSPRWPPRPGPGADACAARWPARCRGRRATSSTSCGWPGTVPDLGDAALRAAVEEGPQ